MVPTDQVHADHVVENCGIYYSPAQKWYYLSNHLPSEMMVFVQSDSMTAGFGAK